MFDRAPTVEAVQGWADVGVDEVIVPDFTLGSGAKKLEALDLFIEEVAPARAFLTHVGHTLEHEATNQKIGPRTQLAYDGLRLEL